MELCAGIPNKSLLPLQGSVQMEPPNKQENNISVKNDC